MKSLRKFHIAVLLSLFYLVHCLPLALAMPSKTERGASPASKQPNKIKRPAKKHAAKKKPAARKSLKRRAAAHTHAVKRKHAARKPSAQVRKQAKNRMHRARLSRKPSPRRNAATPTASGALPRLSAEAAFVIDPTTGDELYAKNAGAVMPIASITKLMTALVVLEARQPLQEVLTVTREDIDRIKGTTSRLAIGSRLTRQNMLHIALMSSENRAASALGRNYPGGRSAFVAAMNATARSLGMTDTRYVEPTGLSSRNVSTPRDLAKLVRAASRHPLIRTYSTHREYEVDPGGPSLRYRNSNRLIASASWDIKLQKTGYINEAGRCVVMHATIGERPLIMVILNAHGKYSRAADANRIRHWIETRPASMM